MISLFTIPRNVTSCGVFEEKNKREKWEKKKEKKEMT